MNNDIVAQEMMAGLQRALTAAQARVAELEKQDKELNENLHLVYLQGVYSRNDEVWALIAERDRLKAECARLKTALVIAGVPIPHTES